MNGNDADPTCFAALRKYSEIRTGKDIFGPTNKTTQSISMTTWFPYENLFGVPERESSLELRRTTNSNPYRLFATDQPMHMPGNP